MVQRKRIPSLGGIKYSQAKQLSEMQNLASSPDEKKERIIENLVDIWGVNFGINHLEGEILSKEEIIRRFKEKGYISSGRGFSENKQFDALLEQPITCPGENWKYIINQVEGGQYQAIFIGENPSDFLYRKR